MAEKATSRHAPGEVDAYLEGLPEADRAALQRVRDIIIELAPAATQRVNYGIPNFRLNSDRVGLSGHKSHVALHTMSPPLAERVRTEFPDVTVSGATIHFASERPLPREVVEFVVRERMEAVGR